MDAPSERRSQRGTKGRPPSRYGEWVGPASESVSVPSGVSGSSRLSRAAFQRKLAETNLAAAEKIAELEREAEAKELKRKKELIERRAALEKAAAAEEAAVSALGSQRSRNSVVGLGGQAPGPSDLTVEAVQRLQRSGERRPRATGSEPVSLYRGSAHVDLEIFSEQGLPVGQESVLGETFTSVVGGANAGTHSQAQTVRVPPERSTVVSYAAPESQAHLSTQSAGSASTGESDHSSVSSATTHLSVSVQNFSLARVATQANAVVSTSAGTCTSTGRSAPPHQTNTSTSNSGSHSVNRSRAISFANNSGVTVTAFTSPFVPQTCHSFMTAPQMTTQVTKGQPLVSHWSHFQSNQQPQAQTLGPVAQAFQPRNRGSFVHHMNPAHSGAASFQQSTVHTPAADPVQAEVKLPQPYPAVSTHQYGNQLHGMHPLPEQQQPGFRSGPGVHHVKPLELPNFNGKNSEYLRWWHRFRSLIHEDNTLSDYHKLARLRECLSGGSADELVRDIMEGPGAYEAALSELATWYGGEEQQIEQHEKEILTWPKIQSDKDSEKLKKFALKLRSVLVNMQSCNISPGRELYLAATQKIPASLLLQYFDQYDDRDYDISTFADWLLDRVLKLRRVDARQSNGEKGSFSQQNNPQYKTRSLSNSHRTLTVVAKTDQKIPSGAACPKCKCKHQLADCPVFKAMSVADRWSFAKPLELCICCLRVGSHRSPACTYPPCNTCKKKHHVLLHSDSSHLQQPTTRKSDEPSKPVKPATLAQTLQNSAVGHHVISFMTAPVMLKSEDSEVECVAVLDPASSATYISQHVADQVGLKSAPRQLHAAVIGGKSVSVNSQKVQTKLSSVDGNTECQVDAWVVPEVTAGLIPVDWRKMSSRWSHLDEIEFPAVGKQIDVLIGLNAISLHATLEERRGQNNEPVARKTPLGWVVMGPVQSSQQDGAESTYLVSKLEEQVDWLYGVERVGESTQQQAEMTAGEIDAEAKTSRSITYTNNRFSVGIPWIHGDNRPHVKSNRCVAERRLNLLEQSLKKRPNVNVEYHSTLRKYLQKGYVAEVPNTVVSADGSNQWFLPHFPVVRGDRETTKVRVVFDGSAEFRGQSINTEMHAGPKMIADLVLVLLRFCQEPIAMVADVTEMFLQVELRPEDRKYHRFLWRPAPDDPVKVFQFLRVAFGMKASPYLAGRILKETAYRFGAKYGKVAQEAVEQDFYVDDFLKSVQSVKHATQLRQNVQCLLQHGSFKLRKWRSNSTEVLETIPEEDRSKSAVLCLSNPDDKQHSPGKTLGVAWDSNNDTFTFLYQNPEISTMTRRKVLSAMASLFDPLGQLSPFTVRGKVLFQSLWILGKSWDEPIPAQEAHQWRQWFSEFPDLSQINAPRCFKDASRGPELSTTSVHVFTDASEHAVAACCYVRVEYPDGHVRVTLAFAKAKPAPTKKVTIPKLELRGAVLGIRVGSVVGEAMGVPISQMTFWTDSMNVVHWVRAHAKRFKTDVANRISMIQEQTAGDQWQHVPGKSNPADKATRGLKAIDLSTDDAWWSGPDFLRQDRPSWPRVDLGQVEKLPEERKTVRTLVASLQSETPERLQPERWSSLKRLIRVTAWCLRFIVQCRRRCQAARSQASVEVSGDELSTTPGTELELAEIENARRLQLALAQRDVYSSTIKQLDTGKPLEPSDPLKKLTPRLDKTSTPPLLVIDGRLKYSEHLSLSMREPIILPQRHHLTRLLIEEEDRSCAHGAGPQHLLARLRNQYWIVNGLAAVKTIKSQCMRCRRLWKTQAEQLMAPLPDARTIEQTRAFANVGLDFGGPFLTSQGRGRAPAKRYVCLFTCLVTRGCHLELAYGLDTDAFLQAFTRFVKRRGTPKMLVSDNGTNFVSAHRELREATEALQNDGVQAAVTAVGCELKWRFNPPRASHHGGVFEIMIKLVKKCLQHVLSEARLTDEELTTALVQTEWILNSRPLTLVSADPQDLEALTPLHFMVGHVNTPLPVEEQADRKKAHPRRRWEVLQHVMKDVWRRWLKEYVPTLNVRQRWIQQKRNIAVGDVVLCMDPDTPRGRWPLGRITEVHPGVDGNVRVVTLQVKGKTYKRPITRLVPLEVE